VVNDLAPEPSFTPWQTAAARRGFKCSISLPVLVDDHLDGALMVYAGEVGAFDDRAQNLLENLAARHPASVKVATLLEKPSRAKVKVQIDYKGFVIEDRFVVGYGLDYNEKYRNLPFVGVMRTD
jgi:transcriptional regulator with GAF, ATPase, and Fis domain